MFCGMKDGWDFKEASALEQVKKCNKPMLFIHGDNDDYVLTENVYSLYEAKSEPKELWIASNTDHAHAYKYHPKEYAELVKSFTDKYLK